MNIFNSKAKMQTGECVKKIFDAFESDVIVVRKDSCQVLCMNEQARAKLNPELHNMASCKRSYAYILPELCEHCPNKDDELQEDQTFDLDDASGRVFSVKRSTITWVDGKQAVMFTARDVDEERSAKDKMYRLAYCDSLTGIPNRQKLKEDFSELTSLITAGRASGCVAIFDLDNFKNINDTYGHNTGDAMLRRLTSHIQADPTFKNHLYRLGGDEFVLLYKNPVSQFEGEAQLRDYYRRLLERALLSYTMPNIEDACTLSMGVAFFPAHGDSTSELLRKADIALYEAKNAGRNRMTMFEDSFDKAKKFKDMYINMQPILIKNGNTYGYELIDSDRQAQSGDDTVSLSEFDRTLDALGLNDIKNSTKFFIAFTKQLMNPVVQRNLPKDKFVIQVRANGKCAPEELKQYQQLCSAGFSLAVVGVTRDNMDRQLMALADFCRLAPGGMTDGETSALIRERSNCTFIAEGVSSSESFDHAKSLGFKLFQGYFFNEPILTQKTKDMEPIKSNYFKLMQLTSTDDYVDFAEISEVIGSDVSLSYKLLRLLNSASVGLRTRVSSILMAVTFLGEENLKKWISVLALRGITDEKPLELVRMSLIRARFGELLAPELKPKRDARHIFMTGLLSLLHIALEKSKEELLSEIPVADEIRESLLSKDGPFSELLGFFKSYEFANWDEVSRFAEKNSLSSDTINDDYIAAVKWTTDLLEASS